MSLVTPREPAPREPLTPHRDAGARRERTTQSEAAVLKARGVRLDVAAASARGKHHPVNEDSHSALDRAWPVYVVADGVGGGAMASWASRELVRRLHRALDRRRVDERSMSSALLDADRDVASAMAKHTAESGAATVCVVRRDRPSAVALADRVGRRLPHLSRAHVASRGGGALVRATIPTVIWARLLRPEAPPTIPRAWWATAPSTLRTSRA